METAATSNYRAHWGLRESPFPSGLAPRLFYQSPSHEEALARLEFLVEQRQRLGLLLGQSGTGKSLILDRLATNLRHHGAEVANLSLLSVDLHEFLWLLAADLGLNPDRKATPFELSRELDRPHRGKSLSATRHCRVARRRESCEAGGARPPGSAYAVGSWNANVAGAGVSRPSKQDQPHRPSAARIGRIADRPRAMGRIGHGRISALGTESIRPKNAVVHGCRDPSAAHACWRDSEGVNQLAALALVAGAALQLSKIDADTIDAVYHELGTIGTAA